MVMGLLSVNSERIIHERGLLLFVL